MTEVKYRRTVEYTQDITLFGPIQAVEDFEIANSTWEKLVDEKWVFVDESELYLLKSALGEKYVRDPLKKTIANLKYTESKYNDSLWE